MGKLAPPTPDANLLVGLATGDDAGVYRITDELALVQTVDFISPVVDDPYLFGQIAAANSLSDVWAMGGAPLTAMNVLLYPTCDLEKEAVAAILAGGADKIAEAGGALVGGHTVEAPELFYGLSVTGKIHPGRIKSNSGALPGDALILTKPLGLGFLSTALKGGLANPDHAAKMAMVMTSLNNCVHRACALDLLHAATDVTGFGLAGHALGVARESGVDLLISRSDLPLVEGAKEALALGLVPAGAYANRDAYRELIDLKCQNPEEALLTLCDPQTSGGLLIACASSDAPGLLDRLKNAGAPQSAIIGSVAPGNGRLTLY